MCDSLNKRCPVILVRCPMSDGTVILVHYSREPPSACMRVVRDAIPYTSVTCTCHILLIRIKIYNMNKINKIMFDSHACHSLALLMLGVLLACMRWEILPRYACLVNKDIIPNTVFDVTHSHRERFAWSIKLSGQVMFSILAMWEANSFLLWIAWFTLWI